MIGLDWFGYDLHGPLQWNWLPHTVQRCNVENCLLSGSVELNELPTQVVEVNVACNKFTGAIDLTRLPNTLQSLKDKEQFL